ncbi:hypothetical protein [Imtechella halotolerans]|uniref:hypothetical protein n=1 Tax=Imtechella halotolerans TaxID=1165090 RepID=UPI00031BA7E6|nr:hypothetical protein [Imtechella halotolerans]WMQ62901.1 hypothetical protein PT603_11245 [Imtechella halotolerans]
MKRIYKIITLFIIIFVMGIFFFAKSIQKSLDEKEAVKTIVPKSSTAFTQAY